jgi:hypothetical protein
MGKIFKTSLFLLLVAVTVCAQSNSRAKHTSASKQATIKEEAVMALTASSTRSAVRQQDSSVLNVGPRSTFLREGLAFEVVVKALGTPASVSGRSENGKTVKTCEFHRGEGRIVIAEFVNDVLVHSQTITTEQIQPGVAG